MKCLTCRSHPPIRRNKTRFLSTPADHLRLPRLFLSNRCTKADGEIVPQRHQPSCVLVLHTSNVLGIFSLVVNREEMSLNGCRTAPSGLLPKLSPRTLPRNRRDLRHNLWSPSTSFQCQISFSCCYGICGSSVRPPRIAEAAHALIRTCTSSSQSRASTIQLWKWWFCSEHEPLPTEQPLYTVLSITGLGSLDLSLSSLVSAALFVAKNKRTFQITLCFLTPWSPSRETADISPPPLTEITRRSPQVGLP
ncbi:hypothetical protein BJ322DRAFT_626813 [Thelephora terrestris]|uniref:Uncharacterized protein n=1 Tax=Thelephora terrestris TaxID=56493 RepID=A0A9P6L9R7_9AGAM|nr:hypothetical protein BJ322DRAFT_626813 [Thelephora terrestris]